MTSAPFDPHEQLRAFGAANDRAGGIASFIGQVRSEGDTEALELLHYEPLTEPGIAALARRAADRFGLSAILIIHRIGVMQPGDPIVLVAASAPHRRPCLDAVDYCMDHLKSASWLWKREKRAGRWHWIEPRGDDYEHLARWE